ncbi:hypothetical protein Q604_UNBC05759G0001, partial [human gut metagenome]
WYAKVAELVDALASGVSVLTDVGVQVPPLAPIIFTSFLVSSLDFSSLIQIHYHQHDASNKRQARW